MLYQYISQVATKARTSQGSLVCLLQGGLFHQHQANLEQRMHGGDTPLHQAAPDGFSRVESGSKENFTEITSISFKFRLMTPMKIRRLCSIPCFRCFGMFTIAPGQRGCSPGYQGWEKIAPQCSFMCSSTTRNHGERFRGKTLG